MTVPFDYWLSFFIVAGASYLATHGIRGWAVSKSHLDLPNDRSSHTTPTPRGGGVAIVALIYLGAFALWLAGHLEQGTFLAMLCGLPICVVGFMDDLFGVSFRKRLIMHFLCAFMALYCLGGVPSLQVGADVVPLGKAGTVVGLVAIVWSTNLFNFMDGIDGIAASEAIFVFASAAALISLSGGPIPLLGVELLAVAACLGFLFVNWAPAKIFMGDVGSSTLGFLIAIFAVADGHAAAFSPFVWLTLGGFFFVDATITVVRRGARGDRVADAHRSHAYQWLSRRLHSHSRATILVWLVNCCWLLPIAYLETTWSERACWLTIVALLPLGALLYVVGAGRREGS